MDEDLELNAFVNCVPRSMTVDSGKSALDLLIKSERVFTDLQRWLEFSDDLEPVPSSAFCPTKSTLTNCHQQQNHIVLRTFQKDLQASMEFRGFVRNKRLNALSQYYDVCYYPEVVENKEEIQERVCTFFEEIKDRIPVEDYIIDFFVGEERIMIIEINPWATTTGGAL